MSKTSEAFLRTAGASGAGAEELAEVFADVAAVIGPVEPGSIVVVSDDLIDPPEGRALDRARRAVELLEERKRSGRAALRVVGDDAS